MKFAKSISVVFLLLALFALSFSTATQQAPSADLVVVDTSEEEVTAVPSNTMVSRQPSVADFVATHEWQEVLEGREFLLVLVLFTIPRNHTWLGWSVAKETDALSVC